MSINTNGTPPNAPLNYSQSTYKYSIECCFQALHPQKVNLLVKILQKYHDYAKFHDKVKLLSEIRQQLLIAKIKVIAIIMNSITGNEKKLNKMKKQLIVMDGTTVHEFATTQALGI